MRSHEQNIAVPTSENHVVVSDSAYYLEGIAGGAFIGAVVYSLVKQRLAHRRALNSPPTSQPQTPLEIINSSSAKESE